MPGSLPIAALFANGAGLLTNGSAVAFSWEGDAPTAPTLVPGGRTFDVLSSGSLTCGVERSSAGSGGALLCWGGKGDLATRNASNEFEQVSGMRLSSTTAGLH